MRRFFVPFIEDEFARFSFTQEETHHLQKVLRLNAGDEIHVFDGRGNEYKCLILEFENKRAIARVLMQVEPTEPESPIDLNLAVALIKGDKFDLVIQKAVELGVSKVVPIITMRSDVKAKNVGKKLERWRKIIIEASKQCGRATLMEIEAPQEFSELIDSAGGTLVLFSEKNGDLFSNLKADKKITAVVGPEGGWDKSEIEAAQKSGFEVVTLGGRILRAETAAISIASLLQHRFGDLN